MIVIATGGILSASLELIGLVLLLPLLTFLGGGSKPQSSFLTSLLPIEYTQRDIVLLACLAVGAFFLKSAISVSLIWCQISVLNNATANLSQRILESFMASPWLTQVSRGSTSLLRTTLTSVPTSTQSVSAVMSCVSDGAVFLWIVVALVVIDPLLAIGTVLYLLIIGILYVALVRTRVEKRGLVMQQQYRYMSAYIIDIATGIREIVPRGVEEYFLQRFSVGNRRFLDASRVLQISNQSLRYVLETMLILGVGAVLLFSYIQGTLASAVTGVGLLLAGGLRVVPSLNSILVSVNTIRSSAAGVSIVIDELAGQGRSLADLRDLESHEYSIPSSSHKPIGLSLQGVSYTYPGTEIPVLRNVSFRLEPGHSLGVVGASGSGKSTLLALLQGLIEADSGVVQFESEGSTTSAAPVGFVPQEVFLIEGTLRENIEFGLDLGAAASRTLKNVIDVAQINDLMAALPCGVDTEVGERGSGLSGGQRQRIGIARALYGNPSLLLLDEITSALDSATEKALNKEFAALRGAVTTVIVAHRLGTIKQCDKVLVLDKGNCIGLGTFSELLAHNSDFRTMVAAGQF